MIFKSIKVLRTLALSTQTFYDISGLYCVLGGLFFMYMQYMQSHTFHQPCLILTCLYSLFQFLIYRTWKLLQ